LLRLSASCRAYPDRLPSAKGGLAHLHQVLPASIA